MRLTCIAFLLFAGVLSTAQEAVELHLSTSDNGYITVIQGFAAELQCTLNTCIKDPTKVHWLKDGLLIYNGTEFDQSSNLDPTNVLLKHLIAFNPNSDCHGECSDESPCADGAHCLENRCCSCLSEEFTLVLKNLSFTDAARYRCELDDGAQQLEFQVEVLESGLKPGFHDNLTYDHSACCEQKGISQQCKSMCKPSDMDIHHFDPTSCKNTDYQSFLGCVTEGGNRSHVHCCKVQLVPPFCFDFCSGNFETLRKSHRLCLYYLPEILECYERAYLPFPDPPEEPTVVALKSDSIRVCWKPPQSQSSNSHLDISHYTINFKQIPSFPFLGGDDGIPILTGEQDYENVEEQEEEYVENAGKLEAVSTTPSSGRLAKRDTEEDIVIQLAEGVTGHLRRKRQTWVFVTHNTLTNDSQYREFKFETINTTDTCYTIQNLRSATRYIVYVTASNEYGTSLPSARSIAGTPPVLIPSNATLPNIDGCCGQNNVSSYCRAKMCDLKNPPSSFGAMAISTACRTEFTKVSPCLADGRNHTECCLLKGVQHDCLKICDGRPEPLGLQSLLCLNLDLNAVYECLREGYITHPSPPLNVTVTDVTATTARLVWSPPDSNAEKVLSYSIYLRKDDHGEPFEEIRNATSPHLLLALEGDFPYMVYVVAQTDTGKSLPSTIEEFYTRVPSAIDVCPFGQPLFHPNGHRFFCGMGIRQCPNGYDCIVSGSETETYCCQTATSSAPSPTTETFKKCCNDKGMSTECQSLCSYNTSVDTAFAMSEQCLKNVNEWVECGTDGRNHRPCCVEEGIPELCLSACSPPLVELTDEHSQCLQFVEKIMKCTVAGIEKLPGPAQNFEIVALNNTAVTFAWEAPRQTTEVVHYQVRLFESGNFVEEKNVTGNTINFNVEPSRKYVANVVTWNNHGSSIPTFNTTFDSPAVGNTGTSPGKPSPPHSVRVVWNHGSSLNITWSFSGLTLDGHIITKPIYKIQYGPTQPADSTASRIRSEVLKTEDMWARLEGLTENTVYDIYASVIDSGSGLESVASEIISVFMTPDSLGMPEPTLTIEPPLQPGTAYTDGQKVNITCKANGPDAKNVNVDISAGENVINSDPGSGRATLLLTVSQKLANVAVVCSASETNGHQNRAETRIRVQFGPEVHVEKPTIRAFKDMSLQLVCLVRGYPQPTVTWSFRPPGDSNAQQPVADPVEHRMESDLGFESVLLIANATGRAGTYFCTASTSAGAQRETSIEVQLNMALPLTPDFVMNCCLEHKVLEQCRSPCNYTLDPNLVKPTNGCEQETPKLLYCAKDGIDHTECCAANGVTKECLPFCDRSIDDSDQPKQHLDISQCSKFAQTVLECFMKSHAVLPSPPGTVHAEQVGPMALEVHWTKPKNSEEIDQYAVYYKPLNDANAKYEMVLTKTDSVVLEGLKSGESYALAVISLNMYGFSQFSTLKEVIVDPTFSRSSSGSSAIGAIVTTLFIIVLASLLILGVIYMTRSNRLPMFIQKMGARGRTPLSDDPAVAFENPGYGTEAQIRGLPGGSNRSTSATDEGAWQSAKLEPAGDGRESPDVVAMSNGHQQRGMRYAKLT